MTRKTWIDDFLERFQHRWETNSQYRAAMSGVLGLDLLITVCGCIGLVSIGATSVLHAMGIGATGGGGSNVGHTNGGSQQGVVTFSVTTVTPAKPGDIPYATIPTSGTALPTKAPSPTPTETSTATPCTSNCGGGGGCNSCDMTITYSGAWTPSGSASIIFYATKSGSPDAGVGVNVFGTPPGCGLVLNNGTGVTDGTGYYTFTFQLCATAQSGQKATFTAEANFEGVAKFYSPSHRIN
jgi:hypothetical protein